MHKDAKKKQHKSTHKHPLYMYIEHKNKSEDMLSYRESCGNIPELKRRPAGNTRELNRIIQITVNIFPAFEGNHPHKAVFVLNSTCTTLISCLFDFPYVYQAGIMLFICFLTVQFIILICLWPFIACLPYI